MRPICDMTWEWCWQLSFTAYLQGLKLHDNSYYQMPQNVQVWFRGGTSIITESQVILQKLQCSSCKITATHCDFVNRTMKLHGNSLPCHWLCVNLQINAELACGFESIVLCVDLLKHWCCGCYQLQFKALIRYETVLFYCCSRSHMTYHHVAVAATLIYFLLNPHWLVFVC